MWNYLWKKAAQFALVLLLISFFSFAIIYIAPGDVSQMYLAQDLSQEQLENLKVTLGLDKSMLE